MNVISGKTKRVTSDVSSIGFMTDGIWLCNVGSIVGSNEGGCDFVRVGTIDENVDGTCDFSTVGSADGSIEGCMEFEVDGLSEGDKVGDFVEIAGLGDNDFLRMS